MGDSPALERPGEFWQQCPARSARARRSSSSQVLLDMNSLDLAGDPLGFGAGLIEHVGLDSAGMRRRNHRSPAPGRSPRCDDPNGRAEDLLGDSEARGQHQPASRVSLKVSESFAKLGDVGQFRSAERIDRLIGVAGDGEIAVGEGCQFQEPGLGGGRVLVLVDQNETVLVRPRPALSLAVRGLDRHGEQGPVVDATPS